MTCADLSKRLSRFSAVLRHVGPFRRATAASVAVEFALIGLLCTELVVETMQVGFYFYTSASLEHATSEAMRQVMTGSVASQGLTAAQFRSNILCPLLPSAMPCASIVTNINTVPEDVAPNGFYQFVNSSQSAVLQPAMDNSKTNFCIGSTGSVVYAQVYYAMPALSPVWRALASGVWNGAPAYFVGSAAAFKNEPFQGPSGAC